MKIVDVEELKNNIDNYIKIAKTEKIGVIDKGKTIFIIYPNNCKLIKRWNTMFGTIPEEGMVFVDNKEIDRE